MTDEPELVPSTYEEPELRPASGLGRAMMSVIQWLFEATADCLGSDWKLLEWSGYGLAVLLVMVMMVALVIAAVVRVGSGAAS